MRTTICVIVFVALGADGKPHPVPRWVPRTEHERLLEDYAIKMMEFRKVLENEVKGRNLLGEYRAPLCEEGRDHE